MLITVILTLLGISFLLMGETESRIAQNEKRTSQALYVAEAGARAVKRWFDRPGTAIRFPLPGEVDRTLRVIIDETDPYDPVDETPADGVVGSFPYYKQGVDLDSNGRDDLFDRPYRTGMLHSPLGTPDGPDLRIDQADAGALIFLEDLTADLVGEFPGEPGGVYSRIDRIDIYAPPYIEIGANWGRYGLATIKVIASIYAPGPSGDRIVAQREVESVVAEVPYRGPYGALHSCSSLTFTHNTDLSVHWGAVSSLVGSQLSLATPTSLPPTRLPSSLPREDPATPGVDPLWNGIAAADFTAFKDGIDGTPIEDPWFRVVSGGSILGAPAGVRPWPPAASPPVSCCDHSSVAQTVPLVTCPVYDYDVFKLVAGSGESDVRYFTWAGGDTFRENGAGPALGFEAITDGEEGFFFFDTADGLLPEDTDGDGDFDNLTDAILVNNAGWHFKGVLYLNAEEFKLDSAPDDSVTLRQPGEPFQDADEDGAYDAGEAWINLDYTTTLHGTSTADRTDTEGGGVMRNLRGPAITANVSLEGILFTSGSFQATGSGLIYGTVVAREGVVQTVADGSQPTPHLFWNEDVRRNWPPPGWDVPRVVVTRWKTNR